MSAVEETRPPITTMASGCEMKPPPPVRPRAIGVSAKTVASAVIRIGRRRWRAPWVIASATFIPGSPFCGWRYWLMRSISTIAFVTTMPTSISMPISEGRPSGTPVMSSSPMAPVAANGTETSRISGWISDLNAATMIT